MGNGMLASSSLPSTMGAVLQLKVMGLRAQAGGVGAHPLLEGGRGGGYKASQRVPLLKDKSWLLDLRQQGCYQQGQLWW